MVSGLLRADGISHQPVSSLRPLRFHEVPFFVTQVWAKSCLLRARPSSRSLFLQPPAAPPPNFHTPWASKSCPPTTQLWTRPHQPWPPLSLQPRPSCQVLISPRSEEDIYPDTFPLSVSAWELGYAPGQARQDKHVVRLWSAFLSWGILGFLRLGAGPLLWTCRYKSQDQPDHWSQLSLPALAQRTVWCQGSPSPPPEFIKSSPILLLSPHREQGGERAASPIQWSWRRKPRFGGGERGW